MDPTTIQTVVPPLGDAATLGIFGVLAVQLINSITSWIRGQATKQPCSTAVCAEINIIKERFAEMRSMFASMEAEARKQTVYLAEMAGKK